MAIFPARRFITSTGRAISFFKLAHQELPGLISCDVHLPKLDGHGVVNILKNDPALGDIPVISVTALEMLGDREKFRALDFDGYIGKPIELEKFVRQIENFLLNGLDPDGKTRSEIWLPF